MKRFFLFTVGLWCSSVMLLTGQSQLLFFDDFESYEDGAVLGASDTPKWEGLWQNDQAFTVSSIQAAEGRQSLKCDPSAESMILYASLENDLHQGKVFIEYDLYVEETSLFEPFWGGDIISILIQNNQLSLRNQRTNQQLQGISITQNEWHSFRYELDLDENILSCFLDGVSLGELRVYYSLMSKISLRFRSEDIGSVYLDKVKVEYEPSYNDAVNPVDLLGIDSPSKTFLVGSKIPTEFNLQNTGQHTIESIEIAWTYNGQEGITSISDLNIPLGASSWVSFNSDFSLVEGRHNLTLLITKVNGESIGAIPLLIISLRGLMPHPDKVVLSEIKTATWCAPCSSIKYYQQLVEAVIYPNAPVQFVNIHGRDPLDSPYSHTIAPLFANYHPQTSVDRNINSGTNNHKDWDLLAQIAEEATKVPQAHLALDGDYNETTRQLTIDINAEFLQDAGQDLSIGLLIIEDDIKGNDPTYNQSLIPRFIGRQSILLNEWKDLDVTISYDKIKYKNVGRAILGGLNGRTLQDDIAAGDIIPKQFTYTIPANYKAENIKVIPVLFNSDHTVNNVALAISIDDLDSATTTTDLLADLSISVSPNPFVSEIELSLDKLDSPTTDLIIHTTTGEVIHQEQISGTLQKHRITLDQDLPQGTYILSIHTAKGVYAQHLIKTE